MGKAVIASTLLLGCAGLFVAASWHTGVRIAATLPALVLQGNTVLQQTLPGSRLTLESLERGVFSSTARYQLQLRPPGQQGHLLLQLISHIEHGPLPRSRLLRLQWQPVQAFSRSQLVETADSKAWFAASQHLPPLQGEMTLAYDGSHRGQVRVAPLDRSGPPWRLRLSGLALDYRFSNDTRDLTLEARTPSLILGEKSEVLRLSGLQITLEGREALQQIALHTRLDSLSIRTRLAHQASEWHLSALALDSQRQRQPSGLYTGRSVISVRQGELFRTDQLPLTHDALHLEEQLSERDGLLEGSLEQTIEQIRYKGEPVASTRLQLSYSGLPGQLLHRIQGNKPEDASLPPAVPAVPMRISLDEGRLQTRHGLGLLSLEIILQAAASPPRSDSVCTATPHDLQGELSVDRALLVDLLHLQTADSQGSLKAQEAQLQAQVDQLIRQALESRMAVREGERLVSRLQYSEGRLMLNGQPLSLPCPLLP